MSTEGGGTQRLFTGIPLSAEERSRVSFVIDSLEGVLPGVRWVRPENLHVTLKFLGECGEASLPFLLDALEQAAEVMPAKLTVGGVGGFPSQRSARIIWVGAEDPTDAIKEAFRLLEKGARKCGVSRETRPYRPHITIGRSGKVPVSVPEEAYRLFPEAPMPLKEIALYSSELSSGPPVYKIIGRAPVGAP
jgi:RNA 2',3'-cyclic 3'-phosphodiesterase